MNKAFMFGLREVEIERMDFLIFSYLVQNFGKEMEMRRLKSFSSHFGISYSIGEF